MFSDEILLLRQIQHLQLIRQEEQRIGSGEKSAELADQIAAIVKKLTPETAAYVKRLNAKSEIFLSPLSKGNCSVCGVKTPFSVLQHVLAKDKLTTCNSCGRILYVPEVKATGIRATEPDPKLLLSRFSTPKLMLPTLKATTPKEAILELAGALEKEKEIPSAERVVKQALEREQILTTAVGHSLAFPHARGVEEGMLTFAAGISPAGIDWNGQKVNLVFFTAFPLVASPFYLKLIAALCKSFEDDEKLPFVMASADAKTMWKELNKATRVAVKNM